MAGAVTRLVGMNHVALEVGDLERAAGADVQGIAPDY